MPVKNIKLTSVSQVQEKINFCENQLDFLKKQRKFPYVYLTVAVPTIALFMLGSIISEGIIDYFSAFTGGLFFSLLISCVYIVVFQPNKEELEDEMKNELKHLWRLKGKLEAGKKGEAEIAYYLTWLNKHYLVFHDICLISAKFGEQQIDHLVIGPNGIFHLETKNINGIIKISHSGDWVLEKHLRHQILTEGMESPHHQIRRHELVINDILCRYFSSKEIHLEAIVAMANSKTIIEGHDPVLSIIKKDKLINHIENSGIPRLYNPAKVRKIGLIFVANCTIRETEEKINVNIKA